jgi:hypothetical protein
MAYAAFDGHRHDDYNAYLYKTDDFGKTWTSLKGNLPFGWIHVVREDPVNPSLLYVGMEFGIYSSLDGGKSWVSLQNNLPTVAVRDIAVHPKENDLIIGTHGRGIWILDDIRSIEEMNPEVFADDFRLFSIRPATLYQISSSRESLSRPVYSGKNPDYGMVIAAYMKDKPKEKPKISVKNTEGESIYEISLPTREGLHRHEWNLQIIPKTKDGKIVKPTGVGLTALPVAFPGNYTIEMTSEGKTMTQAAMIKPDPRFALKKEDYRAVVDAQIEVIAITKIHSLGVTAANRISAELRKLDKALGAEKEIPPAVTTRVNEFKSKFLIFADEIKPKGIGYKVPSKVALRGGYLSQQLLFLGMWVSSYPAAPTEMMLEAIKQSKNEINTLIKRLNAFILVDIPALNETLEANGQKPIKTPEVVNF